MEYEVARHELLEEIARGTSIQDLRARITNKNNTSESNKKILSETKNQIPDDLVQIQAYVRWEKAGKPNYSPDQQLVTPESLVHLFFVISSFPSEFSILSNEN